jgi:phosphatidylinositol-3-phosphatase
VIGLLALLLAATLPADAAVPRYQHVFVIVEENKDYARIVGSSDAPIITRLAKTYGSASQFFAETHPSEPNYVAMIGGSTYGIRDDDAFYCMPHDARSYCSHSDRPGYVNHTIEGPNLASQLEAADLSWKNYEESLPAPGSLAVVSGYYASKHSGFVNFASVQRDPQRARHLVGFDALDSDLHSGNLPSLSVIVPNVCDEMHGASGAGTPANCRTDAPAALIARGDREVDTLTREIMASSAWSQGNAAIVITFDEDDGGGTQGCCGNDPADPSNAGGGHIPTVVITNHGPRGVVDSTPYSHYSLLRTIEDAFGIHDYLMRAGAPGVEPMVDLFKT